MPRILPHKVLLEIQSSQVALPKTLRSLLLQVFPPLLMTRTVHVSRSPSAASSLLRQLIPQPLLENCWTLLAVFSGSQVALAMISLALAPMEHTVVLHTVIHVSDFTHGS